MSEEQGDSEEFAKIANNVFSQIERQLGPEGYAAQVKVIEAQALATAAHAESAKARAGLVSAFMVTLLASVVLFGIPVSVWLWYWALP